MSPQDKKFAVIVAATLIVMIAIWWVMTPTCGPGEVLARGPVFLVCVEGHH